MSFQDNAGLTVKQILYLLDVREVTFVYKDSDMELVKKYKKRGYKKNYDNIDFDNLRKIS